LPTSPSDRPPTRWELSRDSLEKLLKAFSPDAEEGPRLLLLMQKKLMRSFECRGCNSPDDLIDEVINRVARRLEEGEVIYNLNGYFLEVGHRVHQEWLRRRTNTFLDDIPEPPLPPPPDDDEKETRMRCLDHCLEELTVQNRQLILNYYQDERRVKIDHRKQMAETMGIPLNALRIRAHRIRGFLEKCVTECLSGLGLRGNETGL
jgi:RNA polymerase sigma factor (sigma-70 family)